MIWVYGICVYVVQLCAHGSTTHMDGLSRLGKAGLSKAVLSRVGLSRAVLSRAGLGRSGLGERGQGRAEDRAQEDRLCLEEVSMCISSIIHFHRCRCLFK